ncbi:MAG TPA: hypothetical protein VE913_08085 [Longimicrobium sp.]|nr:hypothetical protein [Longimicrobium sp.]
MARKRDRAAGTPGLPPRQERLLRVWELRAARDYAALEALLAPLPDAELLAEPELGVALGEALLHHGGWDRALALAEALAGSCRRAGGGRLERRRLSVVGQIVYARGRIADATGVWTTLLDSAVADGEQEGIGIALLNLGSVAAARAEWEEAMSLFARAIAVGQTVASELLLGTAHCNLGTTYVELGLLTYADDHLRYARRLLRAEGMPYHAAKMESATTLLHLHMGDLRLARWTAKRVLERFDFPSIQADSMRLLGMIAAAEGALDEATDWLRGALDRLAGGVDLVTEAEVHEEWAAVALRAGDATGGAEHEAAAARMYGGLEAPRRVARLRGRLAEIRRAHGTPGPDGES